jgi:GNAT superfamily N-acetyltransferase
MTLLQRVTKAISDADYANRHIIDQGPFRVLIDRKRSAVFVNYAVPLTEVQSPAEDISALVATFHAEGRVPRIETPKIENPELEEQLHVAGFKLERELPLMACPKEGFVPFLGGPAEIRLLGPSDDVRVYYETANRAFGVQLPVGETPVIKGEADKETGELHIAIAYLNGQPVGCACLGPTCELSSVGVLQEFRRRGIAAAVSSSLLEAHFRSRDLAWLTAEDEHAERLYTKLGFTKIGTYQAWAVVPHIV